MDISDLCICYIDSFDFKIIIGKSIMKGLNQGWIRDGDIYDKITNDHANLRGKIKVFLDDDKNDHNYHLVYFEDIHLIRPDLFVTDTLVLAPMDEDMHKSIDIVMQKVENKIKQDEKLQKRYINHISMINFNRIIRRVAYAYTYYMRKKKGKINFTIRPTQIFAVLEACQIFFDNKPDKKKSKGVVYQIKTGEGKSCIVTLIAAVLAIKNKFVHIVSSNIKLSNRDYSESLDFFKILKLESAVLLHKNELPKDYANNNEYPNVFFGDDLFNNPSRMNFSICGVDNNISPTKANIVFSTFVNLECFYLHLIENCPGYIDEYFGKCGLLIDEADSILIDEISNGTIISREMNSNANKVLTYVFDQHKDKKEIHEVYENLKKDPLCSEMTEKDIEKMYKEIDKVYSSDFAKKYSVQTFRVKNNHRLMNMIKKTVNFVKEMPSYLIEKPIAEIKNGLKSALCEIANIKLDDNDAEEEDDGDDDLDTSKYKEFKKIVPFDYENKGILEPNKEFSGFMFKRK